MQILVGVVVFATFIIGVILTMVNSPVPGGLNPFGRGKSRVAMRFPEAPGVGVDTPVRKNGLLIGRVTSIEDADDGVVVHANIDEGRTLSTAHVPHVRTSVLGDATIDFLTDPSVLDRVPRPEGVPISGEVDANPFDALAKLGEISGSLDATVIALGEAGREVADLARRVREVIGEEERVPGEPSRVSRLITTTESAMSQFAQTMAAFNQILGDEPAGARQPLPGQQPADVPQPISGQELRLRLRQGLYELPDAIRETRIVLQSAERNLRHLEGFTQPLGANGPQIAESIVTAVQGIDRLVEEFTVLLGALNDREGTIGQLIHNPQLYQNLNNLTVNANAVVVRLYDTINAIAPRVRQIVDNLHVFVYKIALEPSRLVRVLGEPSVVK
jgi:phospholipid/cholesterol/gamma-HCH transport system substrate-binding protein